MKKTISILLFIFLFVSGVQAQAWYDVTKFGAKKDSSAKATAAIAKAIAAAVKAGGGTIYFPAGKYLTGPIHLKSNITIYIDAGAELHFSDDFNDYLPMVQSRYEGVDLKNFSPLFYAYKEENIAIKGRGIIDGHGQKWWSYVLNFKNDGPRSKWQKTFDSLNANILLPDDPTQMKKGFIRPPFIQPMFCKNVQVEGITIRNSPFWTINPEFCENVTVNGVTINNPTSPNTDGINPESCKYVHISNCHISVGDDCITIKSGKDVPGRTMNMPAQNYTITNCTMLSGHGGVVIGSEMSGGVKNIVISNCVFDGTDRGIRIKTARGRGGVVEDIRVSNIVMKNIRDAAFVLDMEYSRSKPEPVTERTPKFRNIRFSNITAYTKNAGIINGLEESVIEDVSFNDISIDAEKGFVVKKAKGVSFQNVVINTKAGSVALVEDVQDIEFGNFKCSQPLNGIPVLGFNNVQQAFIYNCHPQAATDIFIQLKGSKTTGIIMRNNYFEDVKKAVDQLPEVTGKIVLQ